MDVHFVEATNGPSDAWGKFAVCRFTDDEWKHVSEVDGRSLLGGRGWSREHVLVLDLQTGQGAFFFPAGLHHSDLQKASLWTCPLFEHAAKVILAGDHDPMKTDALLDFPVDIPAGYRRLGDGGLLGAARAVEQAYRDSCEQESDDEYMDSDLAVAIGVLRQALT